MLGRCSLGSTASITELPGVSPRTALESWWEGKHDDSERLTVLLWPPANIVPSTRALLHNRQGGRFISVEGSPMWHLVVRLLPRLLPSASPLRLPPPPCAALLRGTGAYGHAPLPLLARTEAAVREGKCLQWSCVGMLASPLACSVPCTSVAWAWLVTGSRDHRSWDSGSGG